LGDLRVLFKRLGPGDFDFLAKALKHLAKARRMSLAVIGALTWQKLRVIETKTAHHHLSKQEV
jgi:hypothetical protein